MRASLQDKDSGGHSARYEESVLRHCALLWLKSPSTYKLLRKNSVVPLPHLNTISKFVKAKKIQLDNNIESDFLRNVSLGLSLSVRDCVVKHLIS